MPTLQPGLSLQHLVKLLLHFCFCPYRCSTPCAGLHHGMSIILGKRSTPFFWKEIVETPEHLGAKLLGMTMIEIQKSPPGPNPSKGSVTHVVGGSLDQPSLPWSARWISGFNNATTHWDPISRLYKPRLLLQALASLLALLVPPIFILVAHFALILLGFRNQRYQR